jgi:hypothetical protein
LTQIQLRDGVDRVQRDDGQVLILGPDGTALRVSAAAQSLYDLLRAGATFEQLAEALRANHPGASGVEEKLRTFLAQLTTSRLLESPDAVPQPAPAIRKPPSLDMDGYAMPVARVLARIPRAVAILPVVASLAGFVALAFAPLRWPRMVDVIRAHDLAGIAFVLFVAVPLHELAHAVAARLAGVPAGRLGVRLKPFGIPRPYVTVSEIYRVAARGLRCAIPLAGPAMDLVIGGAAAWLMILTPSPAAALVLTYAIVSLTVGTSPIHDGDGSHATEAFFGDETLRPAALRGRRGPFTRNSSVQAYRIWTAVHTVIAGIVIVSLAR